LKGGSSVFNAKGNLFGHKYSPRKNKIHLTLVLKADLYLVITRKTVHKIENINSCALVKDLIDEQCREVMLRKIFIQIMEIHAYMNRDLFLVDWYGVRHPFCQWYLGR
jgi:hypothetical protein